MSNRIQDARRLLDAIDSGEVVVTRVETVGDVIKRLRANMIAMNKARRPIPTPPRKRRV